MKGHTQVEANGYRRELSRATRMNGIYKYNQFYIIINRREGVRTKARRVNRTLSRRANLEAKEDSNAMGTKRPRESPAPI